jgi:hypothetical protein
VEAPTFADWTERYKVYNEYVKALGEYKLNSAKAELELAKAANIWVVVRAKELLVDQLRKDLRSVNKSTGSLKRQIKSMERRRKRMSSLLKGKRLSKTFTAAWNAYLWFETEVAMTAPEKLQNAKVTSAARDASNFFSNKKNDTRDVEQAPSEIVHAGQLANWLRKKKYMVENSSSAWFVIAKLFKISSDHAGSQVKEMRSRIKQIRDDTFEVWDTSFILGLGMEAAKRIEASKPAA